MRTSARILSAALLASAATALPSAGQDPAPAGAGEARPDSSNANPGLHLLIDPDQKGLVDWTRAQTDWARPWRFAATDDGLGASLTPIDSALRGHLGLVEGRGLVVSGVVEGGRAAQVGLKVNDILLTVAGKPLAKPDDLLESLKASLLARGSFHANDPVELTLLRGGKPTTLKVKPEVRVALAPASEEAPELYIGTPVNPLDETFRAHIEGIPAGTGLIVGEIVEGSPAAKAGLKSGDILLSFDSQPVPDADTLRAKIRAKGPHPAKLEILRAGKPQVVTVTPEARKPEPAQATSRSLNYNLVFPQGAVARDVPVLSDLPYIQRFYSDLHAANGGGQNVWAMNPTLPPSAPDAELTKKIDDLTAQVRALTKAVEGMQKERAGAGEKK